MSPVPSPHSLSFCRAGGAVRVPALLLGLWPTGPPLSVLPPEDASGQKNIGGKHHLAGGRGRTPAVITQAPLPLIGRRSVAAAAAAALTSQVEGVVDGRPCCLTVDTGADRTLVRKGVIASRNLPLAPQKMCGVTGHCSAMRGPVEARIEVGGEEMQLPVYVADLEEPCLLGVDYLTKGRACIDFGKGTLRVHDTEVPLLPEDACPEVAIARSAGLASGSRTRGEQQQRRKVSGRGGQVEPACKVPRPPGRRAAVNVASPAATSRRAW